jgi:tetratricopeptide (TPR) repeat protein
LGIFGSFGEHARADRFLYVPMMAVVLAVARMAAGWTGGQDCQDTWRKWGRWIARIGAGGYMAAMAVCAWPVIDSYRSDFAAFSRALSFDPDHGRALAHIGQVECGQPGGIDRGIDHLRKSQAARPRDDTAAHLAYALAMRGHSDDFAEIRRRCGKFACNHSLDAKGQALEALGMTAMRQRRWAEAISCLEDSIRAPRRFYSAEDASLRLAAAYCNAGRQQEAMRTLEPLTQSRRTDIRGKASQALETLKRNPRAVLFLD